MKIDGVFSGGGVKAFAHIGALESIYNHNLELKRVGGTSAGAIVAAFIAAGYKMDELYKLIEELNVNKLLDPPKITEMLPFLKWFFLYFQLGINKGNKLENWIFKQLAKKQIYTFKDLYPGYLKMVVSDLTLGKMVVIPDDLERVYGVKPQDFSVAKAVRMSAGFPFFFKPVQMPNKKNSSSIIVDGGLLSNFPLWIFDNGEKKIDRPVLGVKLTDSLDEIYEVNEIQRAPHMLKAFLTTMKQAHDKRYISKTEESNIILVKTENVSTMDFGLTGKSKEEMIQSGRKSADLFLEKWPK